MRSWGIRRFSEESESDARSASLFYGFLKHVGVAATERTYVVTFSDVQSHWFVKAASSGYWQQTRLPKEIPVSLRSKHCCQKVVPSFEQCQAGRGRELPALK